MHLVPWDKGQCSGWHVVFRSIEISKKLYALLRAPTRTRGSPAMTLHGTGQRAWAPADAADAAFLLPRCLVLTQEEERCRFCDQKLPDWRHALAPPSVKPVTPVGASVGEPLLHGQAPAAARQGGGSQAHGILILALDADTPASDISGRKQYKLVTVYLLPAVPIDATTRDDNVVYALATNTH